MKPSDRYLKIVEWYEDDGCYVGSLPGICGPCCHGPSEARVFRELGVILDEWMEIIEKEGEPLPPPTAGWVTDNVDALRAFSVAMAAARGASRRKRRTTRASKAPAAKAARPSGRRGRARRAAATART